MRFPIRFRFSLRWFLVFVAIFGVAFYFLFVRPTVLADELITKFNRDDYSDLDAELVPSPVLRGKIAQLKPRAWSDVLCFRRRLSVMLQYYPNVDNRRPEIKTRRFAVTTGPTGIKTIER